MYSFHFIEIQKRIEEELAARVSRICYFFNPIFNMGAWVASATKEVFRTLSSIYENSWRLLVVNIFTGRSILDVSHGLEYSSDTTHQSFQLWISLSFTIFQTNFILGSIDHLKRNQLECRKFLAEY